MVFVHKRYFRTVPILGIVVFCFCFDRSSRLVPSVSAFSPSNLRFYISFRSFRPDFLSILYDRGVVPPWKHFSMCMFSFQEAASCALCSILSASCTTFAVCMSKKMYRISVSFVRALYPHWTHYHGFSILIGATHTPSSRLYAAPTAVRTNKNDGAFSSPLTHGII